MTPDWQDLLVLAAVTVAGAYLARVAWRSVAARRPGACGGCDRCATNVDAPQSLVALSSPTAQPGESAVH